jgi:transcriptional regulator with XRE-family HTH domain
MARTKRKNPELAVEIGKVIRRQRKSVGMTQATLAEAIGLESETVSRLENGIRLPSIEKLVEMAEVFRMPVAAFFEHVGASARQQDSQLFAEKISVALDKLPENGKTFVLEVAQNYARYHSPKSKGRRKKN